jgi:hypothetical protein
MGQHSVVAFDKIQKEEEERKQVERVWNVSISP